jgi:hypothetical protein
MSENESAVGIPAQRAAPVLLLGLATSRHKCDIT